MWQAFLAHLDKQLKSEMRYSSRQKDANDSALERERDFRIFHFAGDVAYTSVGFVDKNNDSLFQDLKRMLYTCGLPALQEMWPEGADKVPLACTSGLRVALPCPAGLPPWPCMHLT